MPDLSPSSRGYLADQSFLQFSFFFVADDLKLLQASVLRHALNPLHKNLIFNTIFQTIQNGLKLV